MHHKIGGERERNYNNEARKESPKCFSQVYRNDLVPS